MSYGHADTLLLESRCESEGRQAFREGKALTDNPYEPTYQWTWHSRWAQGWKFEKATQG